MKRLYSSMNSSALKRVLVFLFVIAQGLTPVHAFLVSSVQGERVDIKSLTGNDRWTVVMIWQLNCLPCEEQKPALEAFHRKHQSGSAHVVGLVLDGHEYLQEINRFLEEKPTEFTSHVVFGDVFAQQIVEETGKHFPAAPGYIVYAPNGELVAAINSQVNVDELLSYIETQMTL